MGGTNGLKETTLGVNIFAAPGKAMVGERPKPFGEAFGFDPITSTFIFGEHDAVLVNAVTREVELHDMRYRRSTSFDGGTRDGLETVGPVYSVG